MLIREDDLVAEDIVYKYYCITYNSIPFIVQSERQTNGLGALRVILSDKLSIFAGYFPEYKFPDYSLDAVNRKYNSLTNYIAYIENKLEKLRGNYETN